MMYLLIDKSPGGLPYKDRYVLFDKFENCLEEAKSRGWSGWDVYPEPPPPGLLSGYQCGDIDVSFMTIETRDG